MPDQDPIQFEAIGTHWNITINEPLALPQREHLLQRIHERIAEFDHAYSRFRNDSLVADISRRAGTFQFPEDADHMLTRYREAYDLTGGAFTPLIGQTLVEAGYDAAYSFTPQTLHTPPAWDDVMSWNPPYLTTKKPILLDFGAAGKGYLVDLVSEVIERSGVRSYCVDAGGDIRYRSPILDELRVGLEHPDDPTQVIGIAHLYNQSICGSAGNRRRWKNFHHTIDPRTLESPRHMRAVWVVADSTLLADALTTCLAFTSPDILKKAYTFEYLFVFEDYSIEKSPGFFADLFAADTQP